MDGTIVVSSILLFNLLTPSLGAIYVNCYNRSAAGANSDGYVTAAHDLKTLSDVLESYVA